MKLNKTKNVTVVLDSMAGSCGKGKFIGYLSRKDKVDVAINNFMSNAGHTWVSEDGEPVMTQHLPTSIVSEDTIMIIGPGSAITPSILFNEILRYKNIISERLVIIHPRAMVIQPYHCEKEKEILRSGSTFKGCGTAQADKIMRAPWVKLFGDWFYNVDWSDIINDITGEKLSEDDVWYIKDVISVSDHVNIIDGIISDGGKVMIEGSQGCDLDINYGLDYPHTTSRQCHAGQLIADCGISPRLIDDIIMIMRPYPIRISNTTNLKNPDGSELITSSGDYAGASEISWDEIKRRCGAPDNVEFGEITTVTKKTRRVFELNTERLLYTCMINKPTQIAINFIQYIDYNALNCTDYNQLPKKARDFIQYIENITGIPVTLIGTGPNDNHIIDLRKEKLGKRRWRTI